MGIGVRLQDLSRIFHVLLDILVDVDINLQALLGIRDRLLDDILLPWTLQDQVDDIANEQSDKSDLRCHAEGTDHKANIEAQCRNKANNDCCYQDW